MSHKMYTETTNDIFLFSLFLLIATLFSSSLARLIIFCPSPDKTQDFHTRDLAGRRCLDGHVRWSLRRAWRIGMRVLNCDLDALSSRMYGCMDVWRVSRMIQKQMLCVVVELELELELEFEFGVCGMLEMLMCMQRKVYLSYGL